MPAATPVTNVRYAACSALVGSRSTMRPSVPSQGDIRNMVRTVSFAGSPFWE
jgi:hypothetical protein